MSFLHSLGDTDVKPTVWATAWLGLKRGRRDPYHGQVVRVSYIVGNLTVGNSRLRHTVGLRLGGVDLFAALLGRYTWRRHVVAAQPPPSDALGAVTKPSAAAETDEAVLVKVVRVLANLAIHPQVWTRGPPTTPPDSPPFIF